MAILDFSHLTTEQRLDLIAELCDSIDRDAVPLTDAQAVEIDRRLAMLDEEPGEGLRFRGLGRPAPPLPLIRVRLTSPAEAELEVSPGSEGYPLRNIPPLPLWAGLPESSRGRGGYRRFP